MIITFRQVALLFPHLRSLEKNGRLTIIVLNFFPTLLPKFRDTLCIWSCGSRSSSILISSPVFCCVEKFGIIRMMLVRRWWRSVRRRMLEVWRGVRAKWIEWVSSWLIHIPPAPPPLPIVLKNSLLTYDTIFLAEALVVFPLLLPPFPSIPDSATRLELTLNFEY